MKSGCTLKKTKSTYIHILYVYNIMCICIICICLIFSAKNMLLNSVFVGLKVICCFQGIS